MYKSKIRNEWEIMKILIKYDKKDEWVFNKLKNLIDRTKEIVTEEDRYSEINARLFIVTDKTSIAYIHNLVKGYRNNSKDCFILDLTSSEFKEFSEILRDLRICGFLDFNNIESAGKYLNSYTVLK